MIKRWRAALAAAFLLPLAFTFTALAPAGASTQAAPAVRTMHPLNAAVLPSSLPHTHLPQHLLTNSANGTAVSSNWSGYAAVACSTCHLRYAATSFTVPSVSCANSTLGTGGLAYDANWAGLDGFSNGTVEQTGVSGYCTSTSSPATYYAWYEMYPLLPVTFTGVNPGDAIEADVYFNGSAYQIHLADLTNGGTIATTQPCPSGNTCQHTSAEVIAEDPGGAVAGGIGLADFGQLNTISGQVTSLAGIRGGYGPANGYWTPYAITMQNGGNVMASPGATQGGSAFPVSWLASQ